MTGYARRMWALYEPIHGVTYFTDEARQAGADAGYRGFWMSYFAFRAAPLGPVGPAVASAAFFGFHPSRAGRALPDAWSYAAPSQALDARVSGALAALHRIWGELAGSTQLAEAAALARAAAEAADVAGRVLAAANQALPSPDGAAALLWQACTTLREHRGDGHNAALVTAGLNALEAHLIKAAADEVDEPSLRSSRNWGDAAYAAASGSLRDRGLLERHGQLTAAGLDLHRHVEDQTDSAAELPWRTLGERASSRLVELLAPFTRAVVRAGGYPRRNPVGLALADG